MKVCRRNIHNKLLCQKHCGSGQLTQMTKKKSPFHKHGSFQFSAFPSISKGHISICCYDLKKKLCCFFALFFIQIMNRVGFRPLHTLTLWDSSDLNPDLISLYLKCTTVIPVLHPGTLLLLDKWPEKKQRESSTCTLIHRTVLKSN